MTKQEYINRVLQIMNENGLTDASGTYLFGADTAQVDRYIESSYVEAWRRCARVMPRTWFRNQSFMSATLIPDLPNGTGHVLLPNDFYLLSVFQMEGWVKPVYEAAIENDRIAAIQSNPFTRGSEIRPVCVITVSSDQVDPSGFPIRQLDYYSLRRGLSSHAIEKALYIPVATGITELPGTADLGISPQIVEPLAYLSASTVFTTFEKYDISKALEQKAAEMFPGLARVRGTSVSVIQ
jgi:hypothetical protein